MITPAPCPNCGEQGLAEIDLIIGYAHVAGICDGRYVEWGERGTDVDWNSQSPMYDPPRFVCRSCGHEYELRDGKFVERAAEPCTTE